MKCLKNTVLCLILLAACVGPLLFSGCRTKDKPVKRVILVSMDTTRADHLSCYGFNKKTTPNIDKLAKDGVLFEQCISSNAKTLPAHSTMLTGTNPVYHGVHDNSGYSLSAENRTLAEVLKEKGFKTGAVISSFVLERRFGLNQGFDDYEDTFRETIPGAHLAERKGDEATQVANEWLVTNRDEDFFLFLHYYDPHDAYIPPEPFASDFSDNLYAGEIAYTDFCIKQVLDKLKELKIYDDSLIIIVGDHGEGLGDHGEETHGYFIYQSSLHVPLIVRFPEGQYSRKRIPQTVGIVDIVPTVCGWLGIEPPAECVGQDLTAYLEDESLSDRFIYSESLTPTEYGCSSLLSMVSGPWKYIQSSAPEMYNLQQDPGERENLIEPEAKRARLFQEELKLLLSEQVRTTASRSDQALDDQSRAKLESLGYISSGSIEEDFEFDMDKDAPVDWIKTHLDIELFKKYFLSGGYQQAEEIALSVSRDRPDYAMNYSYLAETQYNLGKYSQSVSAAKKFLQLAPVQAVAPRHIRHTHVVLGKTYFEMKHHDKAVRQLNYALEVETDGFESGKIWNNIGNVYLAQGKLEQALQSYQSAIQQAPSFPLAHSNRGLVYSQMGEYEKALADFEKAVQLNPDWDFAKQQHEKTQETIAQRLHVKKAIVQYKSDLKKSPHNTTLLNQLAGSYLFLGDQEKAVEYWEKVLAVEANSADILNNLAFIYVQKNTPQSDPDKALVYAQKACRLTEHQNPNYLDTLALAHASLGDFQQALDLSHQALTLAVSQNQMGLIQTLQKNIERYEKRMLP